MFVSCRPYGITNTNNAQFTCKLICKLTHVDLPIFHNLCVFDDIRLLQQTIYEPSRFWDVCVFGSGIVISIVMIMIRNNNNDVHAPIFLWIMSRSEIRGKSKGRVTNKWAWHLRVDSAFTPVCCGVFRWSIMIKIKQYCHHGTWRTYFFQEFCHVSRDSGQISMGESHKNVRDYWYVNSVMTNVSCEVIDGQIWLK